MANYRKASKSVLFLWQGAQNEQFRQGPVNSLCQILTFDLLVSGGHEFIERIHYNSLNILHSPLHVWSKLPQ